MSPVLTIFRKELRSYVMTPYGWVILAFVMALQSVSLSGTLKAFQLAPQKEGILFFILHSPMFWFYFLFIFPLLTMRSLAEEEKTGTLESLLTTPIKTWQVVLGKYFSAYAFYIILWLPMLLYPLLADWSNLIVQWIYGYDAGMVLPYRLADWAGAYAILLLVGAWFTAIGIFASSLTGSQIISGIITIGLLIIIIERTSMIGVLKSLGANNFTIRKVFLWFSVFLIGKGMLWGNIIGLAFYFVQRWSGLFKLDPETYYMATVPVSFNIWLFLLLNAGTLLASVLMLLGPSFLITRIHPATSIRYE